MSNPPVLYSPLQNKQSYGLSTNIITAASTVVKTGSGNIQGVIVNSHSSGKYAIYDGTAIVGGAILNGTATLGAAERFVPYFGEKFTTALLVVTAGTVDLTVVYN